MTDTLRISSGKVYDPANAVAGKTRDILVCDGQIVSQLPDGAQPHTIDATGMIVMPGGVEMHAHLASMPINAARQIQSATGYGPVVPSGPQTGRLYSQLGYTVGVEAAVAPGAADHAHMQLDSMPNLDTALLVLMGNHETLIEQIDRGDRAGAVAVVEQLLHAARGYGIKAVNPVGVAAWRRDAAKYRIDTLDDTAAGTRVSPRTMLELLTEAAQQLKLAHPTHIHGPQLGEPGNVEITIEMIRALAGRPFHLAHLQYYAYGKTKRGGLKSEAERLVSCLADHPGATADLGLVAFGPAMTATADLPLEYGLSRQAGAPGRPAQFVETGNEDCFGVMPLDHLPSHPVHSMQWATGLEMALLAEDLRQFALSVDHPNGGSFLNYPTLIAQLMSKPLRDEQLATAHRHARHRTGLGDIRREMSLAEIATLTRAAPAKILGLKNKGHLLAGADADITIYRDDTADPQRMFSSPPIVIKGGRIVVQDGQLCETVSGKRLTAPVKASERGIDALGEGHK